MDATLAAMAATLADWAFLDGVLTSINNKVRDGASKPPLPAEKSGQAARDYLEAVRQRFEAVEEHIVDSEGHPLAYQLGREVGSLVSIGAKRAAKIAHDVAHDMAENFEKTADRMAKGGESLATGLGMGAAVVLIVGLLLLRELKS